MAPPLRSYTTLINSAFLYDYGRQPYWLIIDCRFDLQQPDWGEQAYLAGHIPGAVYFHLERNLSAPRHQAINGGRHPMPSREDICTHFAQLGINDTTQVIAYDQQGGIFAARLWWMLRWIGHEQVAVLNGGLPAWQAMGYPLETGRNTRPPGRLTLQESLAEYISVDTVQRNMQSKLRVLIDARTPDRFRGDNETLDPVAGHIPGALNRCFKDNLHPDGSFKSTAQLRADFERLSYGRPAIHQCGSGVTACHNLLAMAHAGLHPGGLYAGSWSEWIEDPNRPVIIGGH